MTYSILWQINIRLTDQFESVDEFDPDQIPREESDSCLVGHGLSKRKRAPHNVPGEGRDKDIAGRDCASETSVHLTLSPEKAETDASTDRSIQHTRLHTT